MCFSLCKFFYCIGSFGFGHTRYVSFININLRLCENIFSHFVALHVHSAEYLLASERVPANINSCPKIKF
ncbi:hypothetical protein SUGI_0477960 [Cryptomeria japonica]|nr:hypothetical protein SUGI_0477960 [Cryptomeria japonica]